MFGAPATRQPTYRFSYGIALQGPCTGDITKKSERKLLAFPVGSPSVLLSGKTAPLRIRNFVAHRPPGPADAPVGSHDTIAHRTAGRWAHRPGIQAGLRQTRSSPTGDGNALQSIAFTCRSPPLRFTAISPTRKPTARRYAPGRLCVCECGCTVQAFVQIARRSFAVSFPDRFCRLAGPGQPRTVVGGHGGEPAQLTAGTAMRAISAASPGGTRAVSSVPVSPCRSASTSPSW